MFTSLFFLFEFGVLERISTANAEPKELPIIMVPSSGV